MGAEEHRFEQVLDALRKSELQGKAWSDGGFGVVAIALSGFEDARELFGEQAHARLRDAATSWLSEAADHAGNAIQLNTPDLTFLLAPSSACDALARDLFDRLTHSRDSGGLQGQYWVRIGVASCRECAESADLPTLQSVFKLAMSRDTQEPEVDRLSRVALVDGIPTVEHLHS